MLRKSLSLLVCLLGVQACTQSGAPPVPRSKTIPFTSAAWTAANYSATFQVSKTLTKGLDSATFADEEAAITLWDSGTTVSGGTVTINGTTVPSVDESSHGGGTYYALSSPLGQTVPIAFDGSKLVFAASGSTQFAALKDSLYYVNKEMAITSPGVADTLSKSAGFTIAWSHNSGSGNTVVIQLIAIGDTAYDEEVVSDNGSFTITPAMLTNFGTKEDLQVMLTRITYIDTTASDGRLYAMASYSREVDHHYLKP